MRSSQTPVTRGESGTSQLKKELRERDKDDSWKGEALEDAKDTAKHAGRPGAGGDEKTDWLSVPKDGEDKS
jgi:hypothetical protein